MEIPECFYRVSVKALVLNETGDKFLICEEETGVWDLPGGGLDWGMTPQEDLPREINEEMGLKVTKMADLPSYFVTEKKVNKEEWKACVVYEAEFESLDFVPSDECVGIRFVDKDDLESMDVFICVKKLAEMFKPENHRP
jgi:8-oxo-dGTP diphosphatase